MKYLHIDCEMGGREIKYSLLTAYFLVTDEKFQLIEDLFLQVKPDDGNYILSGQGMAVNGINIQEHDKVAMPYKQAKSVLYKFLTQHTRMVSLGDGVVQIPRLTPVGHGVRGDIEHIIDKLISEGSWEQFCNYHYLDTSVILQYLRACGKMPLDTDGSVEALTKYFKLEIYGKFHDARNDAIATARILKKFIELGNSDVKL